MTEQQFAEQLKRLKIFGNITSDEMAEYRKAVIDIGYTEFVNGIDWLIQNYEKHTFPLPSEIVRAIKDAAYRKSESMKLRQYATPIDNASMQSTVAFAAAFRLVWLIDDQQMRKYFWEERLQIAENTAIKQQVEHYNTVRGEIESYLHEKGIKYNVSVNEKTDLVPCCADEDLPF